MTQCSTLNIKLSNSQLNKLKPGIKKKCYWSNIKSNVIGASKDKTNFPHKSLFTDTSFEAS